MLQLIMLCLTSKANVNKILCFFRTKNEIVLSSRGKHVLASAAGATFQHHGAVHSPVRKRGGSGSLLLPSLIERKQKATHLNSKSNTFLNSLHIYLFISKWSKSKN